MESLADSSLWCLTKLGNAVDEKLHSVSGHAGDECVGITVDDLAAK